VTGRKSTITKHEKYQEIRAAVAAEERYTDIERRFSISRHVLQRHFGRRNNGNGSLEERITILEQKLATLRSQRDEAKPKVEPEPSRNNHDPDRLRTEAVAWYVESDELREKYLAFLVEHGGPAALKDPYVLVRACGQHVYDQARLLHDESRKLSDRAEKRVQKAKRLETEEDNEWGSSQPLGQTEHGGKMDQTIGDELERLTAKIVKAATDPLDDHVKPGRISVLREDRELVVQRLQHHLAGRLAQRRQERIKWEANLRATREEARKKRKAMK